MRARRKGRGPPTPPLFFSDDLVGAEGGPEGIEEIEDGIGERYVALPRTSPQEGYRDMEEFTESGEDEDLKEKLYIAIDGQGAFRRFRGVLKQHSEERGGDGSSSGATGRRNA